MATTDRMNETLIKFLASQQPAVLAIKGAWGVGKTYFWNQFIDAKPTTKCRAYSYVSLFGISSVPELRRAIFTRQTSLGGTAQSALSKALTGASTALRGIKAGVKLGGLGIEQTPVWADMIEDKTLNNFLVCIDDLERKEKTLSPSALLGFIASLRDERNCKVVLLYNDDEIVKDNDLANTLAEYREKVIDRELTFKPSVEDSYRIIFQGRKYEFKTTPKSRPDPFNPSDDRRLLEIFASIGTANIRVMRKAHNALDYFSSEMESYPRQWPAFARQVVKICCLHYVHGRDFQIEEALDQNRWISAYVGDKGDETKGEPDKYAPVKKISYYAGETDSLIVEYLRLGYVDWPSHKATLVKLEKRLALTQLDGKLRSIWDKIWNNFQAEHEEFNTAMSAFLIKHRTKLSLADVSQAVEVIREFGGVTPALEKLHEDKISEFVENVNEADLHGPYLHGLNQTVVKAVRNKLNAQVITKPIPEVIKMMTGDGGWSSSDLKYIKGSTSDDFYDYLKSSKDDHLLSRVKRFRERLGGDEYAVQIRARLEQALIKLAKESAINARRIRYGVGFTVPKEESQEKP